MMRGMKRLSGAAAAVLLALVTGTAAAQQASAPAGCPSGPGRVAYINSQVILANTPGRAAAESSFAREMAGARGEVQQLQQQFDSSVATYNRTSVAMTPAARQQRETELRAQQQRIQQRAAELDSNMARRESELSGPIMQRVNAVIEGVRAECNLGMVFDAAAQGGGLITADRALDLSPMVIQRLQAAGALPTDTAAPAPSQAQPPAAQPATRDTTPPPTRRPTQPLRGRRP